jgi:aspartyl-tRNA(Asn)/glutamyl-tRNA(Gln) amidotransferase subunit B
MIIQGKKQQYELVIGLEVHAQVNTNSKLFSAGINNFTDEPNVNVNFVDVAFPGMLPVVNKEAVTKAALTGFAINATVNNISRFDRKNYFYPDLPSGYQITQFFYPIVQNGHLDIQLHDGTTKRIRIERIHLEQDAGKLTHTKNVSLVDLNRAGVPLMEIVSHPDIKNPDEAIEYLKKLRAILRCVNSSDADMEKGSFRCDANVSVMPLGSKTFGTRCEIKNLNSFKFIAKAIEYEANRQVELIENGGIVTQETRLFNANTGETASMRSKENAADYRYFPEPDLLPIIITDEELEVIKSTLPELPEAKKLRYMSSFSILEKDANAIIADNTYVEYFEELVQQFEPKMCITWLMTELLGRLNKMNIGIEKSPVSIAQLSELMIQINNGVINGKIAKDVLDEMLSSGKNAKQIIAEKSLQQVDNNEEIIAFAREVIAANPSQVAEYLSGKDRLIGFFVGEIMKKTQGKANPATVNKILKDLLK